MSGWQVFLIQKGNLESNYGNYIRRNNVHLKMELDSCYQLLYFDFASYFLSGDYFRYIVHSKQCIMVFLIYFDFDVCISQIFDGIPWMTFNLLPVVLVYLLRGFDFVHFVRVWIKHRAQVMVDYYVISIYFWFFITNQELSLYFVFSGFVFFSINEMKFKWPWKID